MLGTGHLQDRCRGALIGVALGDALGAPFEGQSRPVPEELVAIMWGVDELRWTDDTAMTIAVAESIVANGGLDQDHLVRQLADSYAADPHRGYGSSPAVLMAVRSGGDWRDAAIRVADGGLSGDGAAMRVVPVALAAHADPSRVDWWAGAQAEVTHAHPTAIDGARVVALAVRAALVSPRPLEWSARSRLAARLADIAATDELAAGLRAEPRVAGPGVPGTAVAAVPAAVHVAAHHGDDLLGTIRAAIALGGDTDTVAAMAAGIVGAHLGFDAIPTALVDRLEAHDHLINLADDLLAVAIRDEPAGPS